MKKLVYLISPGKINKKFYINLHAVLSHGNVKFFQLRLKNIKEDKLLQVAKDIRKITFKHKVKFIINDNFNLALNSLIGIILFKKTPEKYVKSYIHDLISLNKLIV